MNIAMIGVGKMGLPMARHLAAAGHILSVYDRNEPAQAGAINAGLTLKDSLQIAVAEAEVVVSSLPNDAALLAVADEVARYAGAGTVYVDTSTVSLQASAKAAAACAINKVAHVRATVSGNNKMAEVAQLTVMASGPADAYARVKPLLQTFGPTQFYVGGGDEARLMKLIVNLMIAATTGMLSEALILGEKGGLDWRQMWDVIGASAVGSPIVKAKAAQLRERDYTPTFTVEQMQKDVGLILEAGAQFHVPLTLTASVGQMLHAAAAQGDAELDYAAVIRAAARGAGIATA
ncbi:NAD(P)-dependent oxidoreductase [Variovorax robiniae]|uniref:NAD(P)-dependent oxidoreductase n=1 Tax=Variovorax robiniae TaxID=1836199 RepID=A0ABU8XHQ4_9BURK